MLFMDNRTTEQYFLTVASSALDFFSSFFEKEWKALESTIYWPEANYLTFLNLTFETADSNIHLPK